MDQEHVFKALADVHRRALLDALFIQDGQTLSQLCEHLPMMTRYGVMKHLALLEEAGLITTQKSGREKFHYLNPIPIQTVYDRWVSKYAQPWANALVGLKSSLEAATMTHSTESTLQTQREPLPAKPGSSDGSAKHSHVMQIFIRTTPERLWQALTDGNLSQQYYFGTRVESTWQQGASYRYVQGDGASMIEGQVLEATPPHKLVTTFVPLWEGANRIEEAIVTFEIVPEGNLCKLTVTHDNVHAGVPVAAGFVEGWSRILSGLKTLLETGEALAAS
jgi:uncharacterized protein YndB with AHSA1/START domain/DNA-binding transcriptional ArsR family regulator